MNRAYYSDVIDKFLACNPDEVLGLLAAGHQFSLEPEQRDAWQEEIAILQSVLKGHQGKIYFEYAVPRMGTRIDVLLLLGPVIFVLEFKVREKRFTSYAIDQVLDYALDLKNFHETSHEAFIAPILIATEARKVDTVVKETTHGDKVLCPILTNTSELGAAIAEVRAYVKGHGIDAAGWEAGRYRPTPTIIEAAMSLYNGHSVHEISRSDAGAINLSKTSEAVSSIIKQSREQSRKSICFVTGVPGAGKTLVGLNIATKHQDKASELYSVFLSGNGPLVSILREALASVACRRFVHKVV